MRLQESMRVVSMDFIEWFDVCDDDSFSVIFLPRIVMLNLNLASDRLHHIFHILWEVRLRNSPSSGLNDGRFLHVPCHQR